MRKLLLTFDDIQPKKENDDYPDVVMALLEKDSLPILDEHWQGSFPVEALHSSLMIICNFLSAHFPVYLCNMAACIISKHHKRAAES